MKSIFTSLLVLCAIAINAQFANYYDPANWTTSHSDPCDDGYIDATGAPGSILIASSDNPSGCFFQGSWVSYGVEVAICGTITFNWDYSTADCNGSFYDPFGYFLNNTPVQLSTSCFNSCYVQSGTASIPVSPGDVFAFYALATDNFCGRSYTTISNFSGPDAVCFGDDGEVKVQMCHNGKSICISPNAVPAHLAHGDLFGDCYEAGGCDNGEELQNGDGLQTRSESTFKPSVEALLALSGDKAGFNLIDIAPNPANDVISLTVNRGAEGPAVVTVYNLAGQQMLQSNVDISRGVPVQVNVADLIEGNYTIILESQQGFKMTEKLTIGGK